MNRFCECLECDAVYESSTAKDKVRAELVFTVCSKECEEAYDARVKESEARFKALELDKEIAIKTEGTDVKSLLGEFIKHNVNSK